MRLAAALTCRNLVDVAAVAADVAAALFPDMNSLPSNVADVILNKAEEEGGKQTNEKRTRKVHAVSRTEAKKLKVWNI